MTIDWKGLLKKGLNWWKSSAEGKNRTASGRRISAMFVTSLCYIAGRIIYMMYIIATGIHAAATQTGDDLHKALTSSYKWLIFGFCLDIIFIGLLWGFITQQGIIEFKNGNKDKNKDNGNDTSDNNGDPG